MSCLPFQNSFPHLPIHYHMLYKALLCKGLVGAISYTLLLMIPNRLIDLYNLWGFNNVWMDNTNVRSMVVSSIVFFSSFPLYSWLKHIEQLQRWKHLIPFQMEVCQVITYCQISSTSIFSSSWAPLVSILSFYPQSKILQGN